MSFWGTLLKEAIPIATQAYGAYSQSKSNDKAAKQLSSANQASTDAQLKALEQAQQNIEINRTAASPGLTATQNIISRGSQLTPEQEQAVADSRNQSLNALKGSSLRGSARATAAVLADTDKRVRNNFMTQNRNTSDNAALGLAGQYFGANNNLANNATAQGTAISNGLVSGGNINASNTLGQNQIQSSAIGDIGAVIADSLKNSQSQERDNKYKQEEFGA